MPNQPDPRPTPGGPAGGSTRQPARDASLEDALDRVISPAPWWRRRRRAAGDPAPEPATRRRPHRVHVVVAALGVLLTASLLGIAAPWSATTAPARDGRTIQERPVPPALSPEAGGSHRAAGRPQATRDPEDSGGDDSADGSCPAPLSVVAAPEIVIPLQDLAGTLTGGACPQVRVSAEEPAATLHTVTAGGGWPDVWIPASTLWLRLAAARDGADAPTSGPSLARTPVVLAVPQPVADQLASQDTWPVWLVFYEQVTTGAIHRMSMAGEDTTAGALARVAFAAAAEFHWGDDGDDATFLRTVDFRDSLASADADPLELLTLLETTPPSQADTRVGVFPITEQQLLEHQDRSPATRAVPYGTCEALAEADYPMAISPALDDRLAPIADELRDRLRSPTAIQGFGEAGFRPPRDRSTAPFVPASVCANDPDPVALPGPARWQTILDRWNWTG